MFPVPGSRLQAWSQGPGTRTGKAGFVRIIGTRYQRTLAGPAEVRGAGFITGSRVRARFLPAPADTGIVFRRVDRPGAPSTPARISEVTGSERRTTLGSESGVTLVEHVLAALAGLRIDNCVIELDGPEPPGRGGSSAGFATALIGAGATLQFVPRPVCSVAEPLVVTAGGATLTLHPADEPGLRISYILDYGLGSPIGRQIATVDLFPENFIAAVAPCRTFVTETEARAHRQPTPLRRRTCPPQDPRSHRRSVAVRLRPRRPRHRLPLGACTQCGPGPAIGPAGRLGRYRERS
jgi:hypothetical protein